MKPADRAKFLEVLAGVHGFYRQELSKFAAEVWEQACTGFEVEQFTKALSAHLMDPERGQFMPKPADIVRQLQGTQTDRSLLAWGRVLKAMESIGAYTDVDFQDPAIHAAVEDAGGWVTICRTTYDELPFVQRRFTEAYKAYVRSPAVDVPIKLLGQHSIANAAIGQAGAEPSRIAAPKSMRAIGSVMAQIGKAEAA